MKQALLVLLLLVFFHNIGFSQHDKKEKDPYQEKYEWRIRQEILYDVYIPKDVSEAFLQLNKKIDEPSKKKFKSMPEEEASSKLFFSLGRWMTHNWSLYEGSRLSVYLQNMGIHHPDDMCRFLIIAYHRSINQKPLEIKELAKQFADKEESEKQERLKGGTILHEEKRKVEPPANGKGGHR